MIDLPSDHDNREIGATSQDVAARRHISTLRSDVDDRATDDIFTPLRSEAAPLALSPGRAASKRSEYHHRAHPSPSARVHAITFLHL